MAKVALNGHAKISPAAPVKIAPLPIVIAGKVRTILVSQPKPESEKSPYFDLARKHKVDITFQQLIQFDGITALKSYGLICTCETPAP